jgi:hypothetical protein
MAEYDLRHRLLDALATVAAPLQLSYEQFLEWKDIESGSRYNNE